MAGHRIHRVIAGLAVLAAGLATAPGAHATIPASSYTLSPKPLDAGKVTVGGSKLVSVLVTNKGTQNLGFGMRGITPDNASQTFSEDYGDVGYHGDDCFAFSSIIGPVVFALAPGETCRLYYRFAPRETSGSKTGTAHIQVGQYATPGGHSDLEASQVQNITLPLKGTATGLRLAIDPDALQFATHTVGATEEQSVTVTNLNDVDVEFAPGGVTPSPAQYRTTDTTGDSDCAQSSEGGLEALVLGPGQQCRIPVTFAPTSAGTKTGSIKVDVFVPGDGFDPGYRENVLGRGPATHVSFQAKGKAVAVKILVNQVGGRRFPVDFGNVAVGATGVQAAQVYNPGDTSLVVFGGFPPDSSPFDRLFPGVDGVPVPDDSCFSFASGMATVQIVPPGGRCGVYYSFTPVGNGARSASAPVNAWSAAAIAGTQDVPQTKPQAKATAQLKGKGVPPT